MENVDYQDLVRDLKKKGREVLSELTPIDADQIHMILGISGEAGELLDEIKKAVIYRKPMDIENVIEELGDIEFYLEGLRQSLGLSRDYIISKNQGKLIKRYPERSYSNHDAKARADKQG